MFYMHNAGWGWWIVMSIGMVAFWALIIYAIVWLVRGRPADLHEERRGERPEEILNRRLAQGEISIDEYKQLRAALHQTPGKPLSAENGQPTASVK